MTAEKPALFYCKAGKDRTGLLAMLLLLNAGVDAADIVADYHESDKFRAMALGDLADRRDLQKLDKSIFERAPEHVMVASLEHIRYASRAIRCTSGRSCKCALRM